MWISWRASRQDLDMLFMVLLGIKHVYPLDRGFSFTMMVCFYGWLGDHLVSKQLRSQEPQVTPTIHEGWPFVCCQGWWRRMKKSKQGFGPGLAKDKQKPSHASHFPLLNSNAVRFHFDGKLCFYHPSCQRIPTKRADRFLS
jgi:hypothetical protein